MAERCTIERWCDGDGAIERWQWSDGDGAMFVKFGPTVHHIYPIESDM